MKSANFYAGAEIESGYAGDMSSTVPADKKFTTRQREVYEMQNAMCDYGTDKRHRSFLRCRRYAQLIH